MTNTKMAMSSDFLVAYAKLPSSQQRGVRTLISRFNANPSSSGLNYERIQGARDPNMRSLRIDRGYRAIVSKPERGDRHMLLWADKHDEAYRWALRHRCDINPETGALQIYEPLVVDARARPGPPTLRVPGRAERLPGPLPSGTGGPGSVATRRLRRRSNQRRATSGGEGAARRGYRDHRH